MQIADRDTLECFAREWKLHNPIQHAQLAFAGRIAKVKSVGFHHGSDELYALEGIDGLWHEQCLKPVT